MTLAKFNHGDISAAEACVRLGVCKSQLYDLRAQWLRDQGKFKLGHSGGDHMPRWSDLAVEIAEKLVLASSENPAAGVNYALIADCIAQETGRRFDRTTVMRFCRKTWPLFGETPRTRRPVKRWAMEAAGALWQIDSTPVHLFGPPEAVQHIVAIEDDATREIVAIGIFDSDSVLAEMSVFRMAIEARGVPTAIYTDGFTVFGHEGEDIKTAYGEPPGSPVAAGQGQDREVHADVPAPGGGHRHGGGGDEADLQPCGGKRGCQTSRRILE